MLWSSSRKFCYLTLAVVLQPMLFASLARQVASFHQLDTSTIARSFGSKYSNSIRKSYAMTVLPPQELHPSKMAPASSKFSTDYGADMDQNALMESDMLVVVDENDRIIPEAILSKKSGHTFNAETPRATLHRAFSLFLFNRDNQLLLTQRAADKITFPNVWTNTVCSHPLSGMSPHDEADVTPDAYPTFPGIKHAAIRKCKHELGIDPEYLPHADIQFLTRFHYWAADTVTYGMDSPWGEHEVDYILFLKVDREIPIVPTPDEVSNYKYVSMQELKDMMKEPGRLWSPWFCGIMERGGWDWWADLEGSLAGKYTNDKVTFFDPPVEHQASYNVPEHTRKTGVL